MMNQHMQLLDLLTAYRRLRVIAVACELGLFTHLAKEPLTATELAERSGVKMDPLKVLLEVCVSSNLLGLEHGRYTNKSIADTYLVDGQPLYLGHAIHLFDSEATEWQGLTGLLRTGVLPADMLVVEVEARRFTLAMHGLGASGEAEALAEVAPLDNCRDLVDVGCGSGIYSIALCRRFPELRATLIDRDEVIATTQEIVTASGCDNRISLTVADITRSEYGRDRDAILLSDVLYLTEEICLTLLRSAFRSLAPGGRLIVRGYYSDPDHSHPLWGALFDLARLLCQDERVPITHTRLRGWLTQVGFTEIEIARLTELSSFILAKKT
jgi:SAM-dependent methyltransferase